MNESLRSRSRQANAATSRGRIALAEKSGAELASQQVAAPSQPRLVSQPADKAVPAAINDAQIVAPRKRGPALLDLARPLLKISPVLASFVGCVLVPAFAATIYFAFIASNQYTAQARLVVRHVVTETNDASDKAFNNANQAGSGATGTLPNISFTVTGQDAYIVTSYIDSRAIVEALDKKLSLREIFRRPEADFWARLKRNATIDELTDYWKSMVRTYIDAPSGIVTLRVRAFRPADAVAIANAVLQLSENLVNSLSDRARRDAMKMAEQEVRRAYGMTQSALADLRSLRNSAGMIDPVQAGTEIGKLLLPLMTEKIRLESELFVASRDLDDSAPTIKVLKSQLQSAEQQIAQLRAKLTNSAGGNKTLASSFAKFETLDLKRQFAEKLYSLALIDFARERDLAARQSVYLTVFVPPSLPEESRYPRRMAFPVLIFIGLIIVWAIGAMTVASVQDHRL